MTDAIRAYFESRAPTWNAMMPDYLDASLRRMIAPFAREIGAARALLEIGTGTGALIPHLADCAPDARLVSIDLAHGMLVQARARCPGAWLVEADVHWLPFAADDRAAFDVVVCHNSFPHFADRARALHAMQRVLRPGGQLFILHNNPRARVNAIHTQAGGPIAHDLLPPGEELYRLLHDTGYREVWVDDGEAHYLAHARKP